MDGFVSKEAICFVTTNKNKVKEMSLITGKNFEAAALEISEIQGSLEEIAIDKARKAARALGGAVLVEDSALCFDAFKSLPGPYIRQFLDAIGAEGTAKLLRGFDDHGASAVCTFALCKGPSKEVKLFEGKVKGRIVDPRGAGNFGWDPIFEPEGYSQTFGEMPLEMKNLISPRAIACRKLSEYLKMESTEAHF